MRMRARAFLGNRGCAAQLWIDLGASLGKRLRDFLQIIFFDNIGRGHFSGGVLVYKSGFCRCRRRHIQSKGLAGTKGHAAKKNDGNGENFSHKARDLSMRSVASASDFFCSFPGPLKLSCLQRETKSKAMDFRPKDGRSRSTKRKKQSQPFADASLRQEAVRFLLACCPQRGAGCRSRESRR